MNKRVKKAISLLLAVFIIVSGMASALAAQKISNPQIRNGIDGIDTDPEIGLHNSYGWCGEVFEQTDADYLWIGSNRDLGSNAYSGLESVLDMMSFSLPSPSPDQAAKIYRQRVSDPDAPWELMYENAAISGYRKMIVFNGDLYVFAGQTNRSEANYAFILRFSRSFKKGDLPEIVFWENLRGLTNDYFRSAAVFGDKLYIGTFDSKIYMTDGNNLQNLTPNIGSKSTGWSLELTLDDYGITPGSDIWDIVTFNDALYVFYVYGVNATAFCMAKVTPDGDGYIVREIVGDSEDAIYPPGMSAGRYKSASPFISTSFDKNYVYVGTFSGGILYLLGLANGMIEGTMNTLYAPMEIYRFDENDYWEVVAGDADSLYVAVDKNGTPLPHVNGQRSGFFLQDNGYENVSANMYAWWMAEYKGKLYISTWDAGVFQDEYFTTTLLYLNRLTGDELNDAMADIKSILEPLIPIYEEFIYGNADYFTYKTELAEYILTLNDLIYENGGIDKNEFIDEFSGILNKYFSPGDSGEIIGIFNAMIDEIDANGLDGLFITLAYISMFNNTAYNFLDRSNPSGFDLYVSEDGVNFDPITVDGFGDPYNYGGRVIIPSEHGLYVATANPFNGMQIWRIDPVEPEILLNGPREASLSKDDEVIITALVNDVAGGGALSMTHNGSIADARLVKRGDTRYLTDITWDNDITVKPETGWKSYTVTETETEYPADIYDVYITPTASGSEDITLTFTINGLTTVKTIRLTVDMDQVSGEIVDKTLLGERLALAGLLLENDYSATTWPRFLTAVDEAQAVYDNSDATQEQVNAAAFDLTDAMSRLIPDPSGVDKSELAVKIAQAQQLVQSDYGPVLWNVFVRTRDAAITVYNNPDAQQTGVDNAVRTLTNAMDALIPVAPVVDKTGLGSIIDMAKDLAGEDYTAESWALFSVSLGDASAVYNDANATQAQVDAALANLGSAMDALEMAPPAVPADKSALEAVLNVAMKCVEAEYTTSSWFAFAQSRDAAQAVYSDGTATQGQVNVAAGLLTSAIDALELIEPAIPADKTALDAILKQLPNLNADDYSPQSWTQYAHALFVAQSVYNDDNATQAQVDVACANLTVAFDALVDAASVRAAEPVVTQTIYAGDKGFSGEGEPGALIDIMWPNGSVLITDVDADGKWKASVWGDIELKAGDVIRVYQSISGLNPSNYVYITVIGAVEPSPAPPVITPTPVPSPIATPEATPEATPSLSPQPPSQGAGGQGSGGGGGGAGTVVSQPATPAPVTIESESPPLQAPRLPREPRQTPQPRQPSQIEHIQYVNGYPEGTFHPDGEITRAETAAILYRLLTPETLDPQAHNITFSDIEPGEWYAQSVLYLAGAGVIQGYPEGTFKPDEFITRAEFATLIAKYTNSEPAENSKFPDIEDHWAAEYINSVAAQGLVNGYPDGTYRPENNITRAEAVAIVNRMQDRAIEKDDIPDWAPVFDDVPASHWAFTDIVEASIGHICERKDNNYEIWISK